MFFILILHRTIQQYFPPGIVKNGTRLLIIGENIIEYGSDDLNVVFCLDLTNYINKLQLVIKYL